MLNLDFKNYIERLVEMTGDYEERISKGRTIEQQIRQAMQQEMQWITIDSSKNDDIYGGIDCWITSTDGGKTKSSHVGLQIKARKSGNDVLWETIKPWDQMTASTFHDKGDKAFTGKDMRCKANLMVSVSNDGSTLRFRNVGETKEIAKKMATELVENYLAKGFKWVKTKWGEARISKDPSQQATYNYRGDIYKVNCFILPNSFEWKKDFNLKTPISLF